MNESERVVLIDHLARIIVVNATASADARANAQHHRRKRVGGREAAEEAEQRVAAYDRHIEAAWQQASALGLSEADIEFAMRLYEAEQEQLAKAVASLVRTR